MKDEHNLRDIVEADTVVMKTLRSSLEDDAKLIGSQQQMISELRELLSEALGVASQHRVAVLDAEYGARGDLTRPASDADWRSFLDRVQAALSRTGE